MENVSRRSFIQGAGVAAGAVAASSALTGAAFADEAQPQVDLYKAEGVRATATLENAEPIPPVEAPEAWTAEADVVVVGTGGGMAAAGVVGDHGMSCIVVEKDFEVGGATQHANIFVNLAGSATEQKAMNWAVPVAPYDRDIFLRWLEPNYQFTINDDLLGSLADAAGECLDWMVAKGANLTCIGAGYMPTVVAEGKMHKILSFKEIINQFLEFDQAGGAEFHLRTQCTALVVEDGRVVGIKANGPDGEVYYKANKGVIFCAGGMGFNPDLMKKYIPTGYEVMVMGGPMPSHTGECIRMGLGVGADMAGIDSWCAWESEQDNDTGMYHYFWGARQVTQLPWLNIDIRGKRCNFYEWDEFSSGDPVFYQAKEIPFYQAGEDRARVQTQASRIGHRAYAIFDGKFEDYMWDISNPPLGERRCTVAEDPIPEQVWFNTDWKVEFENALADGRIKKADTLEELAEMLGLKPEVLVASVEQWNADCEAGVDSNTVYPLSERMLNPIVEPPFYGSKIGPRIGKTLCGLRVDEGCRVMNAQGEVIPGLYANFTTAGGACGESTYGTSLVNSSFIGGNGLSWTSGYLAAKTCCND